MIKQDLPPARIPLIKGVQMCMSFEGGSASLEHSAAEAPSLRIRRGAKHMRTEVDAPSLCFHKQKRQPCAFGCGSAKHVRSEALRTIRQRVNPPTQVFLAAVWGKRGKQLGNM